MTNHVLVLYLLVPLLECFLQVLDTTLQPAFPVVSLALLVLALLVKFFVLVYANTLVDALVSVKSGSYITAHLLPPVGSPGF